MKLGKVIGGALSGLGAGMEQQAQADMEQRRQNALMLVRQRERQEDMAFRASEAATDREFRAAEAEKARQFQASQRRASGGGGGGVGAMFTGADGRVYRVQGTSAVPVMGPDGQQLMGGRGERGTSPSEYLEAFNSIAETGRFGFGDQIDRAAIEAELESMGFRRPGASPSMGGLGAGVEGATTPGTQTPPAPQEESSPGIIDRVSGLIPEVATETGDRPRGQRSVNDGRTASDVIAGFIQENTGTSVDEASRRRQRPEESDTAVAGSGMGSSLAGRNNPRTGAAKAAEPDLPPIPAAAIQILRDDPSPEAMREFDEVFGPGAARRALNG